MLLNLSEVLKRLAAMLFRLFDVLKRLAAMLLEVVGKKLPCLTGVGQGRC